MILGAFRAVACALTVAAFALGVVACGGGSAASHMASDKASGLTVIVNGDQVTLKRSATSTAGTGGISGQVACTDNYRKLAASTSEPAPTQPWYAATLITWPAANNETTATLSHALTGAPDLCIAQTSDSSADVVIFFQANVKTGIAKLQQASQAAAALKAAAQVAVAAVANGSFPAVASLVQAMTKQGLYVKQAPAISGATEVGTMYVITGETTAKKLVVALKGTKGTIQTITQPVTGSAKLATVKP